MPDHDSGRTKGLPELALEEYEARARRAYGESVERWTPVMESVHGFLSRTLTPCPECSKRGGLQFHADGTVESCSHCGLSFDTI